jgi:dTDP-4-amino-4,6-dideoxygalactose transaminase
MSAPFLPFARPFIDEDMVQAVADVMRSRWLASGQHVVAFEQELSQYFGGRPTRVMTSATAALEVALRVCRIGPGDEVITTAQGFFASSNMIMRVGATPIFVDCDLTSRNINIEEIEAAISARTKAIMPVHFSGLPCDLDAIYALAARYKLRVIEDSALAIGSTWKGKALGSFGDISVFSFHPNKTMTTVEGGAITFAKPIEATMSDQMRFHGIVKLADGTRDVVMAGGKFNMPDVHAALGRKQLEKLPEFIAKRQLLAQHYFDVFATFPTLPLVGLPAKAHIGEETGHSWNMFCILLPLDQLRIERKALIDEMAKRGIGLGISYEALHLTTLCRPLGYTPGIFPNAERIARETVTLPLYPEMHKEDVERVVEELSDILMQNLK